MLVPLPWMEGVLDGRAGRAELDGQAGIPGLGATGDGWMLLRLLELGGWEVTVRAGFAGEPAGSLVDVRLGARHRVFAGPVERVAAEVYRWAVAEEAA